MSEDLIFYTDIPDGDILYSLDWIFKVLGLRASMVENPLQTDGIDLYYGNNASVTARMRIPYNRSDIILEQHRKNKKASDERVAFDYINAITMLITDSVNHLKPVDGTDCMYRIAASHTFQGIHSLETFPLVNHYIDQLRSLFSEVLDLHTDPFLPKGKKCAILLSHDVDNPLGLSVLRKIPQMVRSTQSMKCIALTLLRIVNNAVDLNYWVFDEIMDIEENYDVKSIFNFSTVASWISKNWRDVPYDIRDPEFALVLERIINRGWEVGLHASLRAYHSLNSITEEKKQLEKASGVPISGVRHHYWFLGPHEEKTLQMHADAGFAFDSSIGFKDSMGFRRSVALPYYPWNQYRKERINSLQLPVLCMDGHLFQGSGDIASRLKSFWRVIETVKRYDGVGVLNWHVRSSSISRRRFRWWGLAYESILKCIKADPSVWVPSTSQFVQYVLNKWKGNGLISAA